MKNKCTLIRWCWAIPLIGLGGLFLNLGCSESGESKLTPKGKLSVLAGVPSGQGFADGASASARFSYPAGVAVDGSGNLYVADSRNNAVRKITPGGVVSTLAGSTGNLGGSDGTGVHARFNGPSGTVVDGHGNVFVVDGNNHTIRKITPDGVVSTLAGSAGLTGSTDGSGAIARFQWPSGLALDGSGNLYVADNGNCTIRKITPDSVVSTLAGTAGVWGNADGTGAAAQFGGPSGVAVDGSGNIFVAENGNCLIRKITPGGVVSTLAGSWGGYADGTGAEAQFSGPTDVAVDGSGNLYVTDTYNNIIRKVTPGGVVSTLAGKVWDGGTTDGTGASARFKGPNRLTMDGSGNLYVTDDNATIRKITPGAVVSTIAGAAGSAGSADGERASARFCWPNGVALDRTGIIYVADQDNCTIRKITPSGVVSTFAGTPGVWGSVDGTGAEAQFSGVGFVTVDGAGTVYATDCYNHTIRKITPGGVVTTLAGTAGSGGSADGQGADARFNGPNDLTVDGTGNLYVADFGNNTIRKITPSGAVSTLAGTAGVSGGVDGIGTAASFNGPAGIAVDASGNVFATDFYGHTVRKITQAGVVTTVAGASGQCGSNDGKGGAARFSQPWAIDLDTSGNLFIGDSGNNTIRKIAPNGAVTTIVGRPGPYSNQMGVLPASLAYPAGLAVDSATGSLYITVPDALLKVTFQ